MHGLNRSIKAKTANCAATGMNATAHSCIRVHPLYSHKDYYFGILNQLTRAGISFGRCATAKLTAS
jgi:hypothetical protein